MDKYLPGIVVFLLSLAVAGILALVRMWQRLLFVEGEMKTLKEEFAEANKEAKELRQTLAQVKQDTAVVTERLTNIANLANTFQHTMERAFELRSRP